MAPSKKLRQQTLFGDGPDVSRTVVNVASVPQRSPFRYPGGKTWLIPRIREWFRASKVKPKLMVEPFAGGGIVGLTVAFEELASRVLLIEFDADVASVWQTILSKDFEWLARRILDFELTVETARSILEDPAPSTRERAFKTIVRNRTLHGGILAPGSRFTRAGEAGRGITSRWYPATLARRIRDIGSIRDRIDFECGDGISVIREHAKNEDTVFFIDPPYTAGGKNAGKRLYAHHSLDHESLFETVGSARGDFLMTYDNANEIEELATRHGFVTRAITMKNTHHAVMSELLVGRDLEWAE